MAFSLVQSAHDYRGDPPYVLANVAYPGNVTAGNLLVVMMWLYPDSATFNDPTDTLSNTWHPATAKVTNASPLGVAMRIYYAIANASGACTVLISTGGSGSTFGASIQEYSGNAASPYDAGNTATGSNSPASLTLSTAANDELIVAMATGNGSNFTAGTGYTLLGTDNMIWYHGAQYDLDVGASGSQTVAFGTSQFNFVMAAAAFSQPAASQPIIPVRARVIL